MKNSIKNTVMLILFVILAPVILLGVTSLGNMIAGKGKTQVVTEQKTTVPTENKNTNETEVPKATEQKVTTEEKKDDSQNNNSNSDTNNSANSNQNKDENRAVAGRSYTVKAGDTLFAIAASAYGETNTQAGVQKIKEANNIQNDNLVEGQQIQIPTL